jgi:glycosyltransferase involved in cell wall biosynthesis
VKILFSSHFFLPSVGGIEEVSCILAHEFVRQGHDVIVVTQTRGEAQLPFEVRRGIRLRDMPALTRWSDIVFHNNISLRAAWPLAWIARPWVVAHHTWIARTDGRVAPVDRLKLQAIRGARNVAVSEAIAEKLGVPAQVIPNPYRDDLFCRTNRGARDGDVLFVGRLVSDKGVDILLDALAAGTMRRATIVGDGPERSALEVRARSLGVEATFAGVKRGEELVHLFNQHRLLVVPSRWEEPFGVVALEGMACGCVPLVARAGGLPEAVGEAGATFETGSAQDLAACMDRLLADETRLEELRQRASSHLERHRAAVIAAQYLQLFEEVLL